MQLSLVESTCGSTKLLVIQEQGDNSPIIIIFPYNITDYTFKGTINFPTPIVVEIGSGITIVNATLGKISLQLTSEQTQDIPIGQYPFDLWSSSPVPTVNTDPITGFFEINAAITRIS